MADELKFERLDYEETFKRFAIPAVLASTKNAIKRKTAFNLPDRPSDMGMKAAEIKAAFWSPVIDENYSAVAEIDRVIKDANKLIYELCRYVEARSIVSADYIEEEGVVRFTFGDNQPMDIDVRDIFLTPVVDGEGEYAGAQEGGGGRALDELSMALGKDTYAGSYAFRLTGFDANLRRYYVAEETINGRSTEEELSRLDDLIESGEEIYYSVRIDFIRTRVARIIGVGRSDVGYYIEVETLYNSGRTLDSTRDYVTVLGHPEIGTMVIGYCAQASGDGSIAMASCADAGGEGCIADKFGFVRGKYNTVGYAAGSVGYLNKILGLKGFGFGDGNEIAYNASESLVGGWGNRVLHKRSVAIGEGLESTRDHSAWFGKYNNVDPNVMFGVGNGSESDHKNIFELYASGDANFKGRVGGDDPDGETDYVTKRYADKMYDETFNITSLDEDKVYSSESALPQSAANGTNYVVKNGAELKIYSYSTDTGAWSYVATCEANKLYTVLEGSKRGIYRYTMSEPYLVPAAVPVMKNADTAWKVYALGRNKNEPELLGAAIDAKELNVVRRNGAGDIRLHLWSKLEELDDYKGYTTLDAAENAGIKKHLALSELRADELYDPLGAAASILTQITTEGSDANKVVTEAAAVVVTDKMGEYLLKKNAYTHPTDPGYKHIPAGGSSGKILKWASDGTAVWANEYSYTLPAATASQLGGIKASYSDGQLVIFLS